ncbi:MAG: gamma-glutamyltranspeptidase / glutathione hydrolase [Solirubrobacteraceae bacterium]|jgi:gamma-glutamyltranspeptidase/glutathione hydrolase|nr:gamma-glutamyltranspeptidase / glutathione hydrolase [Solirubrobacteraceae bacterium]
MTTHASRPTLYASRHAVSAGHHLAAAAGFAVLEAGGNAVDAGCCAGIALAVLHPDEVNFAGVAPIMIRSAAGAVTTVDGLGHWPSGLPADLFQREHGGTMPEGVLRTVVPAAPDAWIGALRDFGTMSFAELAAPAIRFARDGVAVFEELARHLAARRDAYARWPSSAAIFLPGGRPPAVGERFVQADLAATLQHMADEEASAAPGGRVAGLEAARAAFYEGDIAARIVAFHGEQGGYLTREDLASFRCRREPPVRVRWRDLEVVTAGPWCQGPVLAQALRTLEHAGLDGLRRDEADYVHLVLEVLKGAFDDRERRYGDPRFVDVGLDELLSDAHVAARAAAIDPARAADSRAPGERAAAPEPLARARDTSYVCVVDRWGNAFSAVPSDDSSTAPVVPGTGLVPSTRGSQSRPDPRHPSGVAPGKRPRLTPNPVMAVRDDGSLMVLGCPGGDMQVQAVLQVLLNVMHFGMDVQEAIEAPRFSTWSFPSSFAPYEHLRGRVAIEDRFGDELPAELQRRGHDVRRWPAFTRDAAAVEAILADASTGFLRAGADPRQPAYAIAI